VSEVASMMGYTSFSRVFVLILIMAAACAAQAPQEPVITLRSTACFGTCPVYSLEIFENGLIRYVGTRFVQVTGEHRAVISQDAVENLVSHFLQAGYLAMEDHCQTYKDSQGRVMQISDLPTIYSSLRFGKQKKTVSDYAFAPKALGELELEVDRVANSHQWIDDDKDDLKQWEFVQPDVYRRIKPGLNRLMQAAGKGDLNELQREHEFGVNINAGDETGWTALMLASAMCQAEAVRRLLDWGAKVDLEDKRGDTALIGASAAFCTSDRSREAQAAIVRLLLERGASPNTQDRAGETALMAVTTYGNVDDLRVLLKLGARPSVKDQDGQIALDYARRALKKYYDHFWTAELREIVTVLEAQK
jgi:hypothetical protein